MFVKHESVLEIFKIYLRSVIISDTEIIMTSAVMITAPCTCQLLSVLVPEHELSTNNKNNTQRKLIYEHSMPWTYPKQFKGTMAFDS